MNEDFNLLDERWLSVRLSDGHVDEFGLLDVFRHSDQIVALAETAPPNLVAQYRLLLAILHRALTRAFPDGWKDKDRARWYREGLPIQAIVDYLEHWRERFWLFHPEHPFMQVAALAEAEETKDRRSPWTRIDLASASGNNAVVFDHSIDSDPRATSAATALRSMLGFMQFAPGGTVQVFHHSDVNCALTSAAAVIPVGANLAQTLMLCLHKSPAHGMGDELADLPAWERAPLTVATLKGDPVPATGPNDLYTRQSRSILLLKEEDGAIRWVRFGAGWQLANDENLPDPMISFRKGSKGPIRLTFSGGRALWRDLPVLVPNSGGDDKAAVVVNQAANLHRELDPHDAPPYQPLLVAGVANDPRQIAKFLRWRHERLDRLPVALLEDEEKARYLRILVGQAEILLKTMRFLAAEMVEETMPKEKDRKTKVEKLLDTGPFTTGYYATAERALPELLQLLGEGDFERATELWHAALRRSALTAWEHASTGLGRSSRALRADAKFLPRFHGLLNKQVPATESSPTAKEA